MLLFHDYFLASDLVFTGVFSSVFLKYCAWHHAHCHYFVRIAVMVSSCYHLLH